MKRMIDFCYKTRFFFYGALVAAIPIMGLHFTGCVRLNSPFMFYWAAICTIGAITAQFKKEK